MRVGAVGLCPWGGNNGTNQTLLVWLEPLTSVRLIRLPVLAFRIQNVVNSKNIRRGKEVLCTWNAVCSAYRFLFTVTLSFLSVFICSTMTMTRHSIGLPAYSIIPNSVLYTPECVCNNDLQWAAVGQPSYRHGAVPRTSPIG